MSVTAPVQAPALRIGPHTIGTPVVLAPMAGITNRAFRRLCREWGPGCLYVSEMITSRALVERNAETMRLIEHDPDESPRSIQLYGVDPATVRLATRMLVTEDRADHIDLNFGCPVPKVTRKGGGAALPWKTGLFRGIVAAAVSEASARGVPVTVKMRVGIDEDHITYLEAGRIAEAEGVAAVALHARTAAEFYSGHADWSAIATLKEQVTGVPILGNGDIWSADDAVRMMAETGCDGVVVGRGCLGRPWLFGDLARALGDETEGAPIRPDLGFVAGAFRRHAHLLVEFFDDGREPADSPHGASFEHSAERRACRDIRKHVAWYFKGYSVGGDLRARLATVETLAALDDLLGELDADQPYPGEAAEGQRGRAGTPKSPSLPDGWLASRVVDRAAGVELAAAELSVSGG